MVTRVKKNKQGSECTCMMHNLIIEKDLLYKYVFIYICMYFLVTFYVSMGIRRFSVHCTKNEVFH